MQCRTASGKCRTASARSSKRLRCQLDYDFDSEVYGWLEMNLVLSGHRQRHAAVAQDALERTVLCPERRKNT